MNGLNRNHVVVIPLILTVDFAEIAAGLQRGEVRRFLAIGVRRNKSH
jgi:hypothetical protein